MRKPHDAPFILTQEFLHQAYCVEKRRIVDIAREAKSRNGTVIELLKEYGFAHAPITKEWMIEHYVTLQESVDDIATQLERDEASVRRYLRDFGIPIRYKKRSREQKPFLNDRDWLHNQYVTKRHSLHTIADFAHCRVSSVVRALVRLGIARSEDIQSINGESRRRQFTGRKRELILERDEQRCRYPGCGSTELLELHHIVPIAQGGVDSVENGITLCRYHHRNIAARETEFIPLFLSIINQPTIIQTGAARLVSTATQLRLFV